MLQRTENFNFLHFSVVATQNNNSIIGSYQRFTSASTVRGFAEAVKGLDFSKVRAVCIGRQTKAAADALGMQTWMAEKATMDSVLKKVEQLCLEHGAAASGRHETEEF